MNGDFYRDTFDAAKHFVRVLMQQGRVQPDADWNEQAGIPAHYLHSLAADLIGPHGGPGDGFKISRLPAATGQPLSDLGIAAGHYYVAGNLCENPAEAGDPGAAATYWTQRDYPVGREAGALPQPPFLVYLDVWERLITVVEDPNLREPAPGGPDTCTRVQLVWQVKVLPLMAPAVRVTGAKMTGFWRDIAGQALLLASPRKATLRARACSGDAVAGSGTKPGGNAQYLGEENQLYRVEIHNGGASAPSFKWSRTNSPVVFPIMKLRGTDVQVAFPHKLESGLRCGDWVEVVDDDDVLLGQAAPLLQVQAIDFSTGIVALSGKASVEADSPASKYPLLRRWDGWQPIGKPSPAGSMSWLDLEDGIQVQFGAEGVYCTGDYWLIPARAATGDIMWLTDQSKPAGNDLNDRPCPAALPPVGVKHHHAPLSVLLQQKSGKVIPLDLRRVFKPLAAG